MQTTITPLHCQLKLDNFEKNNEKRHYYMQNSE